MDQFIYQVNECMDVVMLQGVSGVGGRMVDGLSFGGLGVVIMNRGQVKLLSNKQV